MIDIESKIISYREDTNDYRLCLTREEIEEIKNVREETIEEALNYCNSNNKDKEECWSCCLSIWEDGKFKGCYLEQLKEQNNQIIKDLAPKGCADMPKEIVCNCTKEQNK